ncbi:MAG: glycosyl hydrolase [Deltaproteobacteria bacterium]|nr:glycosyl hydrolase [Deltaproteobacteria bacterium]
MRGSSRARFSLAWALVLTLVVAGCGGEGGSSDLDASGSDTTAPDVEVVAPPDFDGTCPVELIYRNTAATPRVFAAGEWNDFAESADELIDDGAGRYALELRLPPGLYGYKLFFQGAADPWRLDPDNAYRVFVGDVENSGLRVRDCRRPLLRVVESTRTPAGLDARVAVSSLYADSAKLELSGSLRSGSSERALSAAELTVESRSDATLTAHVALGSLAAGKHTVVLSARDPLGNESERLLLPFWVEESPFEWSDAVIYMAMTDRFRDGDVSNDVTLAAAPGASFEGGDLQGLRDAIEEGYFDDLGVDALWLTPFNENPAGTWLDAGGDREVAGYHGYWPIEPRTVDPRIGGPDALHAMVEAAHARGIRVLMDLVANHVHEEHPYFALHPSWFNDGCVCGTDGCDWTARRLDCLFRPYMPDVNWRNTEASEQLIADALWWLETYDLDGFRIDAVKHVDDAAILNLATRVRERFQTAGTRYFLMGETAMGWDSGSGPTEGGNVENYQTISRYIGPDALDGQFDFVLYYAGALQFLNDDPGRGMAHIDYWSQASLSQYPGDAIMTPYVGSHDTARFITLAANPGQAGNKWSDLPGAPGEALPYDRMYTALGWLFALPGAPLLYYGDEYGEYGASDPDNRHMMRFGAQLSAVETSQRARVSALLRARRELPGLRSREWTTLLATETLWAVLRGAGQDAAVALVNASGGAEDAVFDMPAALRGEATDVLSGETFELTAQSRVPMSPRSVRYLRVATGAR